MSERHLKKGDDLPTLAKNTLRIYSMRYCPYAQRTRLVLAHKKIPHETVNVNLAQKPDWFLERNPVGTVPTLEYNDMILWESAVSNDYLDETHPEHPLNPKDPYKKARQRILLERWGKVVGQFYALMRNPGDEEKIKEELHKHLQVFEDELKDKFFAGDSVGMIDYNIWPHLERLYNSLLEGTAQLCGDFKAKFPRLAGYVDRMLEVPAVKATYTDPKTQKKFIEGMRDKNPKYDDL